MKDGLGFEIQEGDLIAYVFDNSYRKHPCTIGIIEGSKTGTGKTRFISCYGRKENAKQFQLIKITKEQALIILEKEDGYENPKRMEAKEKFIKLVESM